jgi:hypothetical protein
VYSKFSFDPAVVAILCTVDFEIKVDSLDNACWNARDKGAVVHLAVVTGKAMFHSTL